nr:transposase [Candidatus Enterovibrio luxaltus]
MQHLTIDSTGLKVYGKGKRKVWRKLHVIVDINTHEIIAAKLNASNVTDGEMLPNLLE